MSSRSVTSTRPRLPARRRRASAVAHDPAVLMSSRCTSNTLDLCLGVARKSVCTNSGGRQIVQFGARLAARVPRPLAAAIGRGRDALADGDRAIGRGDAEGDSAGQVASSRRFNQVAKSLNTVPWPAARDSSRGHQLIGRQVARQPHERAFRAAGPVAGGSVGCECGRLGKSLGRGVDRHECVRREGERQSSGLPVSRGA
jgi:hypothetical protein